MNNGINKIPFCKFSIDIFCVNEEIATVLQGVEDMNIIKSLQYISNFYIKKINNIINEYYKKYLINVSSKYNILSVFDEIILFKCRDNLETIGNPFFINQPRTEKEGYEYEKEAIRLLNGIQKDYKTNQPFILLDAYGTEFDICAILDIGYIIFLNKKSGIVSNEEFEKIQKILQNMIDTYRIVLYKNDNKEELPKKKYIKDIS